MEPAFLRVAIQLAVDSVAAGGGPFGAIVVRDGEIVGRGRNAVVPNADPTAHAEVEAIRDACRALGTHTLAGCVLYSSCEPCPMCHAAARWARIDAVHFAATRHDAADAGFLDAKLYRELARPGDASAGDETARDAPLSRDDALAPFRAWDAKDDRTAY